MRLHCLGADCRDPVKHSHSDFIYAVAPVLGRCLDKIKGLDERTLKLKELVRLYDLVWEAWSEVWDTPYYTKKVRRQRQFQLKLFPYTILQGLIKDIKAEYSLHTQLVRLREKVQEYENVDWETALEQAVKGSRFDRWADDDYLNALWPPAPPPSPTPYELRYRPWEEMVAELMAEDIENMNEKFRKQEEAEARAKERAENAWENSWNH